MHNQIVSEEKPVRLLRPSVPCWAIGLAVLIGSTVWSQEKDGLRHLQGQHVHLVTDLLDDQRTTELTRVFDLAVPQWCEYFHVSPESVTDWKITAYLIRNPVRFRNAGLLPADLPVFLNGFQRGHEVWVNEQPGDYYLRHLLLHEGTHAFLSTQLGGTGAAWYNEGVAELLATHRWTDGKLSLNENPHSKDQFPYWGRIKMVQDEIAAGRSRTLSDIVRFRNEDFRQNTPYGWSWAVCYFFDRHPAYRDRFHSMQKAVELNDAAFSSHFGRMFRKDGQALQRDWQLFVTYLDYGYDPTEDVVWSRPAKAGFTAEKPVNQEASVQVDSAKGWQDSGLQVEAGQTYVLAAKGSFTVRHESEPWISEPNGITIQYHQGRPLGQLMAAVVSPDQTDGLSNAFAVGNFRTWKAETSGTLYFRINEMAGQLGDNRGELQVTIKPGESAESPD